MKCTKCKIWYKVKIVDQNGISISEKRVKKYVCDLCVKSN